MQAVQDDDVLLGIIDLVAYTIDPHPYSVFVPIASKLNTAMQPRVFSELVKAGQNANAICVRDAV
jgi:hypothetical protein